MSIIQNTQRLLGEFMLSREHASLKRKVKASSLEKAETIALLFEATDPEEYERVKRFIKKLKDAKKKVKALGFYDGKEMPVMMTSKLEYDFYTRKQLNWFLKPSDTIVANFVNEPFELLINLTLTSRTEVFYIMATSRSSFKIGPAEEGRMQYYDMTINLPPKCNQNQYFELIEKYLTMINPA